MDDLILYHVIKLFLRMKCKNKCTNKSNSKYWEFYLLLSFMSPIFSSQYFLTKTPRLPIDLYKNQN